MAAQGNFSRTEILRWHEDGYFGLDLLLRSVKDSEDSPLRPLGDWMLGWEGSLQSAPPPGFSAAAAAAAAAQSSDSANSAHASFELPPVTPEKHMQQNEQGEVGMAFSAHAGRHSQPSDKLRLPDAITVEQQSAFVAENGPVGRHQQQGQGPQREGSHRAAGLGEPIQLQCEDDGLGPGPGAPSLDGFSEQLQRQHLHSGRGGAMLFSQLKLQPVLPLTHYGHQQRQELQQPHEPQLSVPEQKLPMHGSLGLGFAAQPSAALPEVLTAPVAQRPRLPAFVQLHAGGSSQDAEQDADVTELLELLRQPVSSCQPSCDRLCRCIKPAMLITQTPRCCVHSGGGLDWARFAVFAGGSIQYPA